MSENTMFEVLNCSVRERWIYTLHFLHSELVFYQVNWESVHPRSERDMFDVTIGIGRGFGEHPFFFDHYSMFKQSFRTIYPPSVERSVEFIKEVLTGCELSTFEIVIGQEGLQGIKCHRCGLTSWNMNDVKYKFCGKCDQFHYDLVKK